MEKDEEVENKDKEQNKNERNVAASFKLLCDKKMQLLAPLILVRGAYTAAEASLYIILWVFINSNTVDGQYKSEDKKLEEAAYTYISCGIGSITGAITLGFV